MLYYITINNNNIYASSKYRAFQSNYIYIEAITIVVWSGIFWKFQKLKEPKYALNVYGMSCFKTFWITTHKKRIHGSVFGSWFFMTYIGNSFGTGYTSNWFDWWRLKRLAVICIWPAASKHHSSNWKLYLNSQIFFAINIQPKKPVNVLLYHIIQRLRKNRRKRTIIELNRINIHPNVK